MNVYVKVKAVKESGENSKKKDYDYPNGPRNNTMPTRNQLDVQWIYYGILLFIQYKLMNKK